MQSPESPPPTMHNRFFGRAIREQGAAFVVLGRGGSNLLESAYVSLIGVEPIDRVDQHID